MAIWVNTETRVLVQGITGQAGLFHALSCLSYGTRVVAGVTPHRGGEHVSGRDAQDHPVEIPVFDTVQEAVQRTGADTSLVFVPASAAADAILEAADAGCRLVVCITEGIPVLDMVKVARVLKGQSTRLLGPNCPGIISPGQCKVGIMPGHIHRPGRIGVVSRSGTLTYEAVGQLTALGLGQSTCIGIGGDPVSGTNFVDVLEQFQRDDGTDAILLIGEIGGTAEQDAAAFIRAEVKKPVAGLIAGTTAPAGKRMGHAGAIISGGGGTAAEKIEALRSAGVRVADTPADMGVTLQSLL